MSLVARLGVDIPVHQFWAALCEYASLGLGSSTQQEATKQQIINFFNLVDDDLTELDALETAYIASTDKVQFVDTIHRIFMLKETGTPGYTEGTDLLNRINRIP